MEYVYKAVISMVLLLVCVVLPFKFLSKRNKEKLDNYLLKHYPNLDIEKALIGQKKDQLIVALNENKFLHLSYEQGNFKSTEFSIDDITKVEIRTNDIVVGDATNGFKVDSITDALSSGSDDTPNIALKINLKGGTPWGLKVMTLESLSTAKASKSLNGLIKATVDYANFVANKT